ncbi:hypothetical protein SETIT_9G244100v2 [Setaria italica]|uniref:Cationic amino acid transporter C-terminal domain-containing protein n=4 Tax=Setaria TaxID=4554 RepID=A0A368SKA8_SETIT|nr:hypothetical protein SETIT_9G244100v2 [Setaria italica]
MAMARDGLLPPLFSSVNRQTQVPILSTILTGMCAAILAFFMDVSQLAGMVSVGTLLAFTMVAISVLVVRYAPPYEMPMEVALAGTPESLTSDSSHSEQDEQNLEDPFGNEAPYASERDSKVRQQKAIRSIVLICLGAIVFVFAVSFSFLPFYVRMTACTIGGLLVLGSSIVLLCIGQDKRSLGPTGGFMCPLVPLLPICCIIINGYLLMNLGSQTWIRVSIWMAAGALIYFFYGLKHSSLAGMAYHRISPLQFNVG